MDIIYLPEQFFLTVLVRPTTKAVRLLYYSNTINCVYVKYEIFVFNVTTIEQLQPNELSIFQISKRYEMIHVQLCTLKM